MKRFALLVAALAVTANAQAQDSEFKQSGEFRVRYTNQFNITGQDDGMQRAGTDTRFKYSASARKGENLQAYLTLLHNDTMGSAGGNTDLVTVNRAWGWWKATDTLAFKVGRIGIEIADGAVFAENDWEAIPTAHEGLAAMWGLDFANLAFFAVKTAEYGAFAGNSDAESNYYMLSADVKNMPEFIKLANVHVIQMISDDQQAAPAAGQGSMNAQHVGLTVGGDFDAIMYKATAAFQFGTFDKTAAAEQKLSANMFDVMVGYSMPDTMGLKISAGYHMDSGDESTTDDKQGTYQSLYYDQHNYAGLMDVVRWGNLSYWNVNASLMLAEDLELGAGYYMFSRTKDTAGATFGSRWAALNSSATDKDIGSELDIFTNKAYESGFKIGARFGMFMPGALLKNAAPVQDKNLMEAMVQASMAF